VPYGEGLATHTSPESCGDNGNIIAEALTRKVQVRKKADVMPTPIHMQSKKWKNNE
jgi:hypothetical protein